MSTKYDVNEFRNKIKPQARKVDPDEFRPPQALASFRFFILPPVEKGDKVKGGIAQQGMENFYLLNGLHWFSRRPHACPRIYNEQNDECCICDFGFDLMKGTQVKAERSEIAKKWMAKEQFAVNIYFPDTEVNPEKLRGTVKYFNAPKTVCDIFKECINQDDAGKDPSDPVAFGIFFDPENAHSFGLKITKNGEFFEYKTSKFSPKKEPIASTPEAIQKILDQRIDLFSKIDVPNVANMQALLNKMTGADESGSHDQQGGFDTTEDAPPITNHAAPRGESNKPPQTKATPPATTTVAESAAPSTPATSEAPADEQEDSTVAEVEALLREME